MGHLNIVTQETFNEIINEGHISTRGDLKDEGKWIKTTSDLFSDALAMRKGDLVFPWIIKSNGGKNIGFKYVFRVSGKPIFVNGEKYPIKIPLE